MSAIGKVFWQILGRFNVGLPENVSESRSDRLVEVIHVTWSNLINNRVEQKSVILHIIEQIEARCSAKSL